MERSFLPIELAQERPQMLQRPCPVANRMFNAGGHFTERSVVLRNQEQRIVTECSCATQFARDDSMTTALDRRLNFALRIGQSNRADIVSRSPIIRKRR